jgi:hypothetical protein
MKNKNIFVEAKTLNDRERHLAREMTISRMAHTDRGRERRHLRNNIKVKLEQLKLSFTLIRVIHQRGHKQSTPSM